MLGVVEIRRMFFKSEDIPAEKRKHGPTVLTDDFGFDEDYEPRAMKPASEEEADLIGSATNVPGLRMPVIDIDIPGALELVPSTTEGHMHLYINVPMSQRAEDMLLRTLVEVGLVEEGFARVSYRRRMTTVRKPGVKKEVID